MQEICNVSTDYIELLKVRIVTRIKLELSFLVIAQSYTKLQNAKAVEQAVNVQLSWALHTPYKDTNCK